MTTTNERQREIRHANDARAFYEEEWIDAHRHILHDDDLAIAFAADYAGLANKVMQARLDEVVKVLQSLPLEDFTDDMANHDAAEFVDHAGDFFEAMQLARRYLAELEKGE